MRNARPCASGRRRAGRRRAGRPAGSSSAHTCAGHRGRPPAGCRGSRLAFPPGAKNRRFPRRGRGRHRIRCRPVPALPWFRECGRQLSFALGLECSVQRRRSPVISPKFSSTCLQSLLQIGRFLPLIGALVIANISQSGGSKSHAHFPSGHFFACSTRALGIADVQHL